MKFSTVLSKLIENKDLTMNEADYVINAIVDQQLTEAQIGALLIGLQKKGISVNELFLFTKIFKSKAKNIKPNIKAAIDVCGTGGDQSNTFNVSTISSFILASQDINVAKHGNRSVSSKCGSGDILEALGVNLNLNTDQTGNCLESVGITFLFAPNFHPAFNSIIPIRRELGVTTIFNMLGPLLNPIKLQAQVIGVNHHKLTELYAKTLRKLGLKRALIVHGSGLDEITICGKTKITDLNKNKITTYNLNPEKLGFKLSPLKEITSIGLNQSKEIFLSVLKGEKSARRDLVLLNAAAGFIVAEKANTFKEGVALGEHAIDSGLALKKFEDFREYTINVK